MKQLLILVLLCSLSISTATAQNKSINQFICKHKKLDDSYAFNIPGFLFNMVGNSTWLMDKEDTEAIAAMKIMRKVNHLKIFVSEHADQISYESKAKMIAGMKKNNYEELMVIRDQGSDMNIYIREKKDCIRNVFIMINDGNEMICLSMRSKLKLSDFGHFLDQNKDIIKVDKELIRI